MRFGEHVVRRLAMPYQQHSHAKSLSLAALEVRRHLGQPIYHLFQIARALGNAEPYMPLTCLAKGNAGG
jgi:hypothetical protein